MKLLRPDTYILRLYVTLYKKENKMDCFWCDV